MLPHTHYIASERWLYEVHRCWGKGACLTATCMGSDTRLQVVYVGSVSRLLQAPLGLVHAFCGRLDIARSSVQLCQLQVRADSEGFPFPAFPSVALVTGWQ